MADRMEPLEEEYARLRARMDEIESELRRKPGCRTPDEEVFEMASRIPNRIMDHMIRLSRGFLASSTEQFRLSAEVAAEFAEQVFAAVDEFSQNDLPSSRAEDAERLSVNFPVEVFAAFVGAVDQSLDIPARAMHKFVESFDAPLERSGEFETMEDAEQESPCV